MSTLQVFDVGARVVYRRGGPEVLTVQDVEPWGDSFLYRLNDGIPVGVQAEDLRAAPADNRVYPRGRHPRAEAALRKLNPRGSMISVLDMLK